jgi:hypothetical protein
LRKQLFRRQRSKQPLVKERVVAPFRLRRLIRKPLSRVRFSRGRSKIYKRFYRRFRYLLSLRQYYLAERTRYLAYCNIYDFFSNNSSSSSSHLFFLPSNLIEIFKLPTGEFYSSLLRLFTLRARAYFTSFLSCFYSSRRLRRRRIGKRLLKFYNAHILGLKTLFAPKPQVSSSSLVVSKTSNTSVPLRSFFSSFTPVERLRLFRSDQPGVSQNIVSSEGVSQVAGPQARRSRQRKRSRYTLGRVFSRKGARAHLRANAKRLYKRLARIRLKRSRRVRRRHKLRKKKFRRLRTSYVKKRPRRFRRRSGRRRQRFPKLFPHPTITYPLSMIPRFQNFFRLRFISFYARLGSFLVNYYFRVPLIFRVNVLSHIHTLDFYLNFITTRLYYRYILSDVIKPIVRLAKRYYRGFRILCNGRFTRAQMATSRLYRVGSLRSSEVTAPIFYGQRSVTLKYGVCNMKIWLRF